MSIQSNQIIEAVKVLYNEILNKNTQLEALGEETSVDATVQQYYDILTSNVDVNLPLKLQRLTVDGEFEQLDNTKWKFLSLTPHNKIFLAVSNASGTRWSIVEFDHNYNFCEKNNLFLSN